MAETWLDASAWYYKPSVGNLWQERFKGKRFDSYLGRSSHPTQNHILKLFLRIYLNPVLKNSAIDANKKVFPLKDWTPKGFEKFKKQFEEQSRLWNHRFWLIPPRHFSIGDADLGSRFVRPNVECALFTEIVDSPAAAHRTVDAYNIDLDEVKRQNNSDDDTPYLGSFRNDDHHVASTAVNTGPRTFTDDQDEEYTIEHHYTIAHEIGHAIGLSHIGIAMHTEKCEMALQFAKDKTEIGKIPLNMRGGGNADVCYGKHDKANLTMNIMGKGYKFEEINASPWKHRLAMHTNTLASDWNVSLVRLHPQNVSEKDRHATNHRKWVSL